MATTITDLARRLPALFAAVSLAGLAACSGGGGSGGAPPTSLKGASFWTPSSDLDQAALRNIEGGVGNDFGSVIYIDDGFAQFLQEQTQSGPDGTNLFQQDGDNLAIVSTPDGQSPSQYSDIRLLRLVYLRGGELYVQDGILGRFTSENRMALASGTATFTGVDTSEVLVSLPSGGTFDLLRGDVVATADFDGGRVDVTLSDFAPSPDATFDEVRVNGMTISGSGFRGGSLVVLQSGQPTGDFSGGDFQSSGLFAGWNDSNGTAAGGNIPAELGGAFLAATTDGTVVGRYVAD